MGRGSVWDDEEVVVMDGGGRCRAVMCLLPLTRTRQRVELYPLHVYFLTTRKVVSQEDGAIASRRRAGNRECVS